MALTPWVDPAYAARREARKRHMRNTEDRRRCYGCTMKSQESWEHATWCPKWHYREGGLSGS